MRSECGSQLGMAVASMQHKGLTAPPGPPYIKAMLGVRFIRTGATVALLTAALLGCAVSVPFIQMEPLPAPAPAAVATSAPTPADALETAALGVTPARAEDGDLWLRVSAALTLSKAAPTHVSNNPLAQLEYGKRFLASASAQAEPYLFYIVNELDRRQLPLEIALIPLLESGYNAGAGSRTGPSGLWQLVPATGDRFGLQRNAWYDGRRDVVASTDAALKYFEHLRDQFHGDWPLAFAAYNCGERAIAEAVERNRHLGRPTDFWSLAVPGHTRKYLERLLATVQVMTDPRAYGVTLAHVPERPYLEIVDVGANLALSRIADVSGFGHNEFAAINPGFLQRTTVAGATHVLVKHLHGNDVALALSAVADEVRRLPALTHQHAVKSGETPAVIAARNGVTVAALEAANHFDSTRLRVGQLLNIPGGISAQADSPSVTPPKIVPVTAATAVQQHVVASGDNWWDLARRYNVSAPALAQANGLTTQTILRLGQKLRLPAARQRNQPAAAAGAVASNGPSTGNDSQYEVRAGDSLWTIAHHFDISVDALKKWNRLPERPALQPGQRLVINDDAT